MDVISELEFASHGRFVPLNGKSLFKYPAMTAQLESPLHPDMTMSEILGAYPGARRALFAKYHIGGCRSCGFADTETLAQVCKRNEDLPPQEVIDHLSASRENDAKMQISPADLASMLASDSEPTLIDVRSSEEHEAVHLPGSVFLSQELMQEIFGKWDKSRSLVLYCHHGDRSLDLAAYFIGHGFAATKSLAGGIDAWSCDVDATVPRYKLEIE